MASSTSERRVVTPYAHRQYGWVNVALFGIVMVVATARLGIGLIRRRIALAEIQRATPVRNAWWNGWGVRLIPGGMMYNVYGLSAVELVLVNGSRFRIGTDEPDALTRAIRAAVGG